MEKILLIEDGEVQINWAKESLKEHQLTVAENVEDAKSILAREEFDIIISDLELPLKKGDDPSIENGKQLFLETLLPKRETLKGLALVSNYEHHLHKKEDEMRRLVSVLYKKVANHFAPFVSRKHPSLGSEKFGIGSWKEIHRLQEEMEKTGEFLRLIRIKPDNNVGVIIDLHITSYPNYYLDGEILTNAEVEKRFEEVTEEKPQFYICKEKGAINLKPFKEVVDAFK